jgi:hypothetical protein
MSDAQDANRRKGGGIRLLGAEAQARAPRLNRSACAAISWGLRNTYAELLKAPLPKQLTDLVIRLYEAQEAKSNGS